MNIQQLEYIIALDTHRHFVKAAETCFVTQATLSTMVKKLEEELGVKIFDRSKLPIIPTETGKKIIAQAKNILQESHRLQEIVQEQKGKVTGELRIGIIPTLAPYLLPLFLNSFLKKYPELKLKISELTTDEIIHKLERLELDAGILATPLNDVRLYEESLFFEEFVVYASSEEKLMRKKYVIASDIDINRLWLLEEGHCLRSQVINLCELKNREKEMHQLSFEAGTIETLKKIVDINQGITILPMLALKDIPDHKIDCIRYFKSPVPVREIGIVTFRKHIKRYIIDALKSEILSTLPLEIKNQKKKDFIKTQLY